ncbi:hypothetical protein CTAYLR_010683 [Chrysophaeum taylorii]|uniref:Meiotic nuclear division protein 1 homolog n=1 Tax=Chrysophaeum taylorii TaxID=2483200 RepID=A0AAD7XJP2_9STRA|nr:hypothetical protein CTAYLR_010683 [Chrysophaeum taylorii]
MGRGMSMEEKKKVLLKVYHTKLEPLSIKELEKEGAKAGLFEKQVKEINAVLLDENLVNQDKIGQANVFWSFPAAQGASLRAQLQTAKRKLAEAHQRVAAAKEAEADALVGREDEDGTRSAKLRKLGNLVAKKKAIEADLAALKENDPEELERLTRSAAEFKEHAERWTENLFALKHWLIKKKGAHPQQVDSLFKSVDLPANLDLD